MVFAAAEVVAVERRYSLAESVVGMQSTVAGLAGLNYELRWQGEACGLREISRMESAERRRNAEGDRRRTMSSLRWKL